MLIATVVSSVSSGGLVTVVGYYNPFILPSMVLFTVGSGMITTFSLTTPFREWFGYQVLAGTSLAPFPFPPKTRLQLVNSPGKALELASVSRPVFLWSRT